MKRALFVFAPMALVGCGPNYDRTDITNQITVTANAEVSKYRIVVTKNTAAKAHIESFDSSSNTMRNDVASLDTSTRSAASRSSSSSSPARSPNRAAPSTSFASPTRRSRTSRRRSPR